MEFIKREEVEKLRLEGRVLQKVVGKEDCIQSERMTMGFAYYSPDNGAMKPHHHAEETVYIISARKAWTRFGPKEDKLGEKVVLEAGMVLHFDELEWHVFEFEADGYIDLIFFYGQVTNIRPEEMLKNR
jgi:hypothetical protein